jgi:hypothetical protein
VLEVGLNNAGYRTPAVRFREAVGTLETQALPAGAMIVMLDRLPAPQNGNIVTVTRLLHIRGLQPGVSMHDGVGAKPA